MRPKNWPVYAQIFLPYLEKRRDTTMIAVKPPKIAKSLSLTSMKIIKQITKIIFALFFIAGGLNHFIDTPFYQSIMPPYLPWPYALVIISGIAEVVLGISLLIPRLSRGAAWGLIALLIAVFPANIHMAVHPELFPTIPVAVLWLRLPVQGLLVLWAYWYTRVNTA